jgi:multiple sugar transport system substrate-binding protein
MLDVADLEHRVTNGDLATSGDADLLLVNTDWLPCCIERELLLPLTSFIDAAPPIGWPDAWSPALLHLQCDRSGEVYGLPYHDGPVLLLYRSDLYNDDDEQRRFRALHGSELAPPRTWEELLVQARFFTRPEVGLYGTILAGLPDAHNDDYDFLTQLWSRGGEVLDPAGRPVLDSPEAREAAQFIFDLWNRERIINPAARGWDSVESGVHFAAGEAALMVNWCGFASLASDALSPTHGKLACAPSPAGPAPLHRSVTMSSYWVLAIPRGSKDPDAAYRFMRHAASPAMDKVTAEEQATAVRLDSWRDKGIQALAPYYGVLESAHEGARSVPRDARWPAIADVLNEAMREIIVNAVSPEGPLLAAQYQLEILLATEATP